MTDQQNIISFYITSKEHYIAYLLNEIVNLRAKILNEIKSKKNENDKVETEKIREYFYHILLNLKSLDLVYFGNSKRNVTLDELEEAIKNDEDFNVILSYVTNQKRIKVSQVRLLIHYVDVRIAKIFEKLYIPPEQKSEFFPIQ